MTHCLESAHILARLDFADAPLSSPSAGGEGVGPDEARHRCCGVRG